MTVMYQRGEKKDQPDERKNEKAREKKEKDDATLKAKIDEMVKHAELVEDQKLSLAEKRYQEKEAKWLLIREVTKRKEMFDERRLKIKGDRVKAEILERERRTKVEEEKAMVAC